MSELLNKKTRLYLYGILTAVGSLLVFYGFVSDSELAIWLQLLGVILLIGEGTGATHYTLKELLKSDEKLH